LEIISKRSRPFGRSKLISFQQLVEFVYSFEETAVIKVDVIKDLEQIMDINILFLSHIVAKSSRMLGEGSFMTLIRTEFAGLTQNPKKNSQHNKNQVIFLPQNFRFQFQPAYYDSVLSFFPARQASEIILNESSKSTENALIE
jgi:hypothetical protein